MKKDLIILRGIPGSGKSSYAEAIVGENGSICCADDWFIKEYGEYKWSFEDAGKAHAWCQDKARISMGAGRSPVIIANTNTREKDYKYYVEQAKKFNYKIHHVIIENRHGGTNEHGVPEETLSKMENRLRQNIKLR